MAEPISNDDLNAYADGELDEARRTEIEVHLADHPQAADYVQAVIALKADLHAAYDPVLSQPLSASELERVLARRRPPSSLARVAAAIGWIAIGGIIGWVAHGIPDRADPLTTTLAQPAAEAHVVYTREKRHAVEVWADQRDHLVTWLSKRLGHSIISPDLRAAGYQLVGGRLLPAQGRSAAQFMYEDQSGSRLTLYVRSGGVGSGEADIGWVRQGGVGVCYWTVGPLAYALVGGAEKAQLLPIAERILQQLRS